MVSEVTDEFIRTSLAPSIAFSITMEQLEKSKLSEIDKMRSAVATHKLYQQLVGRPAKRFKKYAYSISNAAVHIDNPIQFEIRDSIGVRLATFGFLLQVKGKRTSLVITGIQGTQGKAKELAELSAVLGENWRVWGAKRINRIARFKKIKTAVLLPGLYGFIGCSPKEYKRQLRQYAQTARKAGIKNVRRDNVSPYPEQLREIWAAARARRKAFANHLARTLPR